MKKFALIIVLALATPTNAFADDAFSDAGAKDVEKIPAAPTKAVAPPAFAKASIKAPVIKSAPAAAPATKPAPPRGPSQAAVNAASGPYLNAVRNKILHEWILVDGKNRVNISCVVSADGATSDVQIVSTPKSDQAETSSKDAFDKAQPFPALPKTLGSCAKLTITFVSTADPHGDSNSHVETKLEMIAPTREAGPSSTAKPASQ